MYCPELQLYDRLLDSRITNTQYYSLGVVSFQHNCDGVCEEPLPLVDPRKRRLFSRHSEQQIRDGRLVEPLLLPIRTEKSTTCTDVDRKRSSSNLFLPILHIISVKLAKVV